MFGGFSKSRAMEVLLTPGGLSSLQSYSSSLSSTKHNCGIRNILHHNPCVCFLNTPPSGSICYLADVSMVFTLTSILELRSENSPRMDFLEQLMTQSHIV